jgi:CSLREA domain-containing protein
VASGVYSAAGSMTIRSSIVAANRGSRTKPDVHGEFVTSGFNLIGNVGQATGFSHPSDRVGTATSLLNPRLDPLANYGGRTPTHRPQPMSPAIDHGNSFSVRIDQRGSARVIDQIAFPSPGGSDAADVGSYEAGHYLVVTKIEDTKDGTCDSDCSLREAIEAAAPGSAIVFAEPLFASPRTLFLNTSEGFRDLFINKGLTIAGRGAHLLTIQRIDGTDSHRLFNISGAGVQVDIHGVTLHHGRAIGSGGALNVNEGAAVKLSHCAISGSSAFRGGGLFIAPDSRMTLLHSTVAGNHASNLFTGGGIHNEGILTVVNSTISGNSTDGLAGGIWSTGTATISSSTVTDNGANPETGAAGGIARASGTVTIVNSIVAANRNNQTRPDLSGGNFASQGFNLIGTSAARPASIKRAINLAPPRRRLIRCSTHLLLAEDRCACTACSPAVQRSTAAIAAGSHSTRESARARRIFRWRMDRATALTSARGKRRSCRAQASSAQNHARRRAGRARLICFFRSKAHRQSSVAPRAREVAIRSW